MPAMRVELINIGTELLLGFVVNTHAAYLGQKLSAIGATLGRQVCVNDAAVELEDCLREALHRSDLVITSGGLGPTSDDITRNIVARHLGLRMDFDEVAMERIGARYRRRGTRMPESVRVQAMVPRGATVFYNDHGTAPGLAIPTRKPGNCRWLVLLPGPPRELRPMFETQVMPLLLREYQATLPIVDCRVLRVVGLGESVVAERVEPLLRELREVEIGYCARMGEVELRLIVRGREGARVRQVAERAEGIARKKLGQAIFGVGDVTLEQVVVGLLREKQQWLATAESCTGGCLANRITMVPGSSEIFREGWVVYSDRAKAKRLGVPRRLIEKHGAVSGQVAKAMAEGALRIAGVDYALAVTGIAGPTGGTTDKPVGTVHIAFASKRRTHAEKFCFQLDRETFKFITSQTALDMLRLRLLRES